MCIASMPGHRSSSHNPEQDEVFRRAVYERDGERSAIAPTPADLAGVLRSWEVAEVFPIGALDIVCPLLSDSPRDHTHHCAVA
jgi:hypothetical protein